MRNRYLVFCLIITILTAACQPATAATNFTLASNQTASPPPTPGITVTPTLAPALTPTRETVSIWLPDYLPERLSNLFQPSGDFKIASVENEAAIRFDRVSQSEIHNPGVVPWIYALVAPFPTITDEVTLSEIQEVWSFGSLPGLPVQTLFVDSSTHGLFEQQWGKASAIVKVLPANQIIDTAWGSSEAWAIIPFEAIEPRWKVLAIDGQSPIQKNFSSVNYGLTMFFGLQGPLEWVTILLPILPPSNRQEDKMTVVILTGVTALVRGTASLMEGQGMTYPARDIGDWLREADILHISNEVPFAKNCPQPFNWEGLVFCSQTEYIQLLESIETDVVELTGDHFKDWGTEAMLYTLELYKERGWKYYGGGANADEASQPALFEHNSNRIAFTGCNAKEEGYSGANTTTPGAIHCDFNKMQDQVEKLSGDGYLPIVTFQHLEYYSYFAHPILQNDFQMMADSGAVIVSGSQAHQPHAFEFRSGALLHYGLGNLFFDQTNQGDPPRTAFIDRHIFYEGRHISTELLTIYLVDYARSRPMTPEERQSLLEAVFKASNWTNIQKEE